MISLVLGIEYRASGIQGFLTAESVRSIYPFQFNFIMICYKQIIGISILYTQYLDKPVYLGIYKNVPYRKRACIESLISSPVESLILTVSLKLLLLYESPRK